MIKQWKVVRITLHPRYFKVGIRQSIERSIISKLVLCNRIEEAITQGWLDEVHPARGKNPSRRFAIYLTDKQYGHEIPITFSLMLNGEILRQ